MANPYYQVGNAYGANQDWYNTPLVSNPQGGLSALSPAGEFERYLATTGFDDASRRSTFARGQYGRTQTGYQAAQLANPDLTYRAYLNQHFGGFDPLWQSLTPDQRGEQPNRFGGPIRWTARG